MALVVRGVVGDPVLCVGNAVSRPHPGLTKAWSRRPPASARVLLQFLGAGETQRWSTAGHMPFKRKPSETDNCSAKHFLPSPGSPPSVLNFPPPLLAFGVPGACMPPTPRSPTPWSLRPHWGPYQGWSPACNPQGVRANPKSSLRPSQTWMAEVG
jgi:hypothetical protein